VAPLFFFSSPLLSYSLIPSTPPSDFGECTFPTIPPFTSGGGPFFSPFDGFFLWIFSRSSCGFRFYPPPPSSHFLPRDTSLCAPAPFHHPHALVEEDQLGTTIPFLTSLWPRALRCLRRHPPRPLSLFSLPPPPPAIHVSYCLSYTGLTLPFIVFFGNFPQIPPFELEAHKAPRYFPLKTVIDYHLAPFIDPGLYRPLLPRDISLPGLLVD